MCVTICGRFRSDEGAVAGYGNRIRVKYTAKWGVQIAGMIFQTRSNHSDKTFFVYISPYFMGLLYKESIFCVKFYQVFITPITQMYDKDPFSQIPSPDWDTASVLHAPPLV